MRRKNTAASRKKKRHHATSGALVGQGAAVSGVAARARHHGATGALIGGPSAIRFNNKRGQSLLYRNALEILRQSGAETSPSNVRRALQEKGVIRVESGALYWSDDERRQQKTSVEQFDDRIYALKKK